MQNSCPNDDLAYSVPIRTQFSPMLRIYPFQIARFPAT